MSPFSIFPPRASTVAGEVDELYIFLLVIGITMTLFIFAAVAFAAIRYRRRDPRERPKPVQGSIPLEIAWTLIPFGVMLIMFSWGAKLYFKEFTPPADAMDVYVTGKQWMWKLQHAGGQSEINELHVPTGRPVRLILTSEDVVHSFYIPAFRVKHDVLPGRSITIWFQATKPGRYHLFCAEYCGTNHSKMIGWVTVMEPAAFESWLSGDTGATPAERGEVLFGRLGCAGCHMGTQSRCPPLQGVYGRTEQLQGGATAFVDEDYIHESIVNPNAKVVAGYPRDVMPSFAGQIDDAGLRDLIAYVKSLSPVSPTGAAKGKATRPAAKGKATNTAPR